MLYSGTIKTSIISNDLYRSNVTRKHWDSGQQIELSPQNSKGLNRSISRDLTKFRGNISNNSPINISVSNLMDTDISKVTVQEDLMKPVYTRDQL